MNSSVPSEEPKHQHGRSLEFLGRPVHQVGLNHDSSIEQIANFLCRTPSEVRQRIGEIAEADAIGDPLLLRDGLTCRDRIALKTYRDARAAMALIREAVEDCALPGTVAREDQLKQEFTVQAEALVRGIYAIAGRSGRPSRARSSD